MISYNNEPKGRGCIKCQEGKFSPNGKSCMPCQPGFEALKEGMKECTPTAFLRNLGNAIDAVKVDKELASAKLSRLWQKERIRKIHSKRTKCF